MIIIIVCVIVWVWDVEYKELIYNFCKFSFDDDFCLCYWEVNFYYRKEVFLGYVYVYLDDWIIKLVVF